MAKLTMNPTVLAAMLPLLLVALLGRNLVLASGVLRSREGNGTVPSSESLTGCRTSCGDLTFSYPFGIGPGCFRKPDFELICNDSVQPPRLSFPDGVTQVTNNISIDDTGSLYRGMNNYVRFTFPSTILPVRDGVNGYNMSWHSPGGESLEISSIRLNVTGCDFKIYVIDRVTNCKRLCPCQLTCPATEITDTVARQNCNGTGCCPVYLYDAFELKFVRHRKSNRQTQHMRSSLWHYINVTTISGGLYWKINDQPSCAWAMENTINFACASKESRCFDSGYQFSDSGYYCRCNSGYMGNPYVLAGCSRDKGYNPAAAQKASCSRTCGHISVPFPFGVEEGCYGRKQFYLNCTNVATSTLLLGNYFMVIDIDVREGLIKYNVPDNEERSLRAMTSDDPGIFINSGRSVSTLEWVVANLSCSEAKLNRSRYACGGKNSDCIQVNSTDGYAGYRCKCTHGFEGNPYNHTGCHDIDECSKEQNKCPGAVCHNTIGNFSCTSCPQKTVYDPTINQCLPVKGQKNVLIGIIIGLSSGFSALFASLSGIYVTRKWKRNIQERQRRMYFRRNKGLLLEQSILTDENASENTKIFSLEELEKATNNFDSTRILGRGGHGMVYKGILSDQRVVAIKRSKITEEDEINQFINEVAILSQINHRNIVRLFGCCLETEVPLLVYDFIPNGSLYGILHGDSSNDELLLSWDACLRIAAEAAGALYYLHSAASVSVFHRDVKSSNILLDANYTAKVSDFGSSRLVPLDQTHVVTNIQGTFGYLDPEYYHTGQLNEKSDVYSFGVVLLELLVRKKPILTSESGEKQNLGNYFLWERKARPVTAIVDPQVLEEASEEEINCVASLAQMCLSLQGDKRPTMKQVEVALQFLRTKKAELKEAVGKDEERETLKPKIDINSYQLLSAVDFGTKTKSVSSEDSHKFYSLEEEFLSTAGLPR